MFKLAMIGLDSSHTPVFTKYIQGKDKMVDSLRVVSCMRFPSPFQSEADQDGRQKMMEDLGVKITRSFAEAVEGVDGIMLEVNDPAQHLEYFKKAAGLGLPVFLDKPLADSLENGQKIYDIAKDKNLTVWSSSSLRFTPEVIGCASKVGKPELCNIFGPLGKAAAGNSLIWYGIHSFEMLMTLMGRGAQSISAYEDEKGVVSIVRYKDGRRAVVECNNDLYVYGGRVQDNEKAETFITQGSPYPYLIAALEKFFIEGTVPVAFEDTLEIQAMLNAATESIDSGKEAAIRYSVCKR